jgi:two-component system NarL family response regulator
MRVLLVDDHHLFLEGLRSLLTGRNIEVVGLAHDGFEALCLARSMKPDLILMDIKMPRCNGVDATRLIKAEMPECKVVMLTMSDDEEDLFEAIESGACGYLLKYVKAETLYSYLQDTLSGHAVLSNDLAAKILDRFRRTPGEHDPAHGSHPASGDGRGELSAHQLEILMLISQGRTYKQVAESMGIAERTVKYHMGQILERLHLENRAQAIAYAAGLNPLCPDDPDIT